MPAHDVLGVGPDASPEEARAAFRRFAAEHHPDRGGTAAAFQAGVDAYHRLTRRHAAAPAAEVVFHRRRRVPPLRWWPGRQFPRRHLL